MLEKIKNIFRKRGGWITLSVATILLTASPQIYWHHIDGQRAICGKENKSAAAEDGTLQKIILNSESLSSQSVIVSGHMSYLPNRETFYLRDGLFSVPLDVSNCQLPDSFKNGKIFTTVKGTILLDKNNQLIMVSDLQETVPDWIQVMYSGGFWVLFLMLGLAVLPLLRLLRHFFVLIGLMKPKLTPTPTQIETRNEKKAGWTLVGSIITVPFAWFLNPYFGAIFSIFFILTRGLPGLESQKRKVAIIGIILCVAISVAMTIVNIGLGRFQTANMNLYSTKDLFNFPVTPSGKESLEIEPYVDARGYFSIHQPKGWVVDENEKDKEGAQVMFKGPETGSFKGKPSYAKIGANFFPAPQGFNLESFVAEFLKEATAADKNNNMIIIQEGEHTLAGGQITTYISEITSLSSKGEKIHALALMTIKNNTAYILSGVVPVAYWDQYGQVIRDSLQTFEALTFADCLKSKGATLYGSLLKDSWCGPACEEQNKLFGDNVDHLSYVECSTPDGKYTNDVCATNTNIKAYPTWEFADGSQLEGGQFLKTLSEKTGCVLPK